VRLSSLEPDLLTDEVLMGLSRVKKLCPHFHLSLQSGSDGVLQRMSRRYSTDEYFTKVQTIRALFGTNTAFTTDMMVGFPGESDAEFAESLAFAREIGFAKIHVFPFSARAGTLAAAMRDHIPDAVKRERRDALLAAANDLRAAFLSSQVGQTLNVLVEQNSFGYAENYAPVKTIGKIKQNEIINVKIKGEKNNGSSSYLYGEKI
jgi:threonylcarbamoyladenosine tRNA methylthiotransferase MtaB